MNADFPVVPSAWRIIGGNRVSPSRPAVVAALALGVVSAACVLAPLFAPFDPAAQPDILGQQGQAPSLSHPLGTDSFSRDVLSRVLYGGRISLLVAAVATAVSVTIGTAFGALAGYAGGFAGDLMQRIIDALLSIPRLLLLIAIFAAWHDLPPAVFILILGLTGWYSLARLVRGQVLALKSQDFVAAAAALGARPSRIFFRHILPNALTPVIVAATLGIGHVIALEAGLSYLGIGVRPPSPSWGNMIQEGSDQIANQWWVSLFPGIAIVITVMASNVLGDALLKRLQPRQVAEA